MSSAALAVAEDRKQLEGLLLERPQQPYAFYRGLVPEEPLRRLSLERAFELFDRLETSTILKYRGSRVEGLACWSRLAWDSRQFGMPAGRLEMLLHAGDYRAAREGKASLASELVKEWQHSHMHHLTARVDAGDLSTLHVLEEAGFEIIDGIQTLSLRLSDAARPASCEGLEVRAFRPADLEAVLAIARTAYVYDRFHADAALADGVADAINEEWTRNCCLGRAADHVVVAVEGGRVVGYVTCKVDRRSADDLGVCFGSIVLVATTAEEARGRGAARQATLGALEWFRRQGVGVVEVGTQLRNIPAARLYEGCGFRQAGVSLTLRKLF